MVKKDQFRNATKFEFTDISSEQYREYTFECGETVRIEDPLYLHVKSDSGSHRVFDASGKSYRISPSFISITWEAKPDEPHFVK